jgi:hypothetical protein
VISPVTRPLPVQHSTTQTQKKRGQTSTRRVGFEPTIPVFEQAKTFRELDRQATVIGIIIIIIIIIIIVVIIMGHYATSRKVAGSIPDETIGFFN